MLVKSPDIEISEAVIFPVTVGAVKVLFVKVSIVSLPTKVVVASGIVTVRSAVGSATARIVSNASLVAPSKASGLAPKTTLLTVKVSVAESPIVILAFASISPFAVIVPEAVIAAAVAVPVITGEAKVLLDKVSVVSAPTIVVVTSGKVIVRSAVGSTKAKLVSKPSAVAPSKINGEAP